MLNYIYFRLTTEIRNEENRMYSGDRRLFYPNEVHYFLFSRTHYRTYALMHSLYLSYNVLVVVFVMDS